MNNSPSFDQSLAGFNTQQLETELLKRQIHKNKCVVIETVKDGNVVFSIDNDKNLLLEIGIKKHRIHNDDIKKLLILFELVQ